MIRSLVDDLDFNAREVVLREKKRDRSKKLTFRRVPMSGPFQTALSIPPHASGLALESVR